MSNILSYSSLTSTQQLGAILGLAEEASTHYYQWKPTPPVVIQIMREGRKGICGFF